MIANLFARVREGASCAFALVLCVALLCWLATWDTRDLDSGEYEYAQYGEGG